MFEKNRFGVMQGRLLPKFNGRYQAHPLGYWEEEFSIAENLGLDCVEFILDYNDFQLNPLLSSNGIDDILAVVERTGITVETVCADYFMEAPLHSDNDDVAKASQNILRNLVSNGARLGLSNIVIPCVDQSALRSQKEIKRFIASVEQVIGDFEDKGIYLSLETDLPPGPFSELLNAFDSDRVSVNYDIGNSAALGFNPEDEFKSYGNRITDVHIKDRMLHGGPVKLGCGNADFELCFNKLRETEYSGPFIMQAYRDDEGVALFKEQLLWIFQKFER